MLRVKHRYPVDLMIDGQRIYFSVKRLSVDERAQFFLFRQRAANPESERRLLLRKLPDEFERAVPTEAEKESGLKQLEELDLMKDTAERMIGELSEKEPSKKPLGGILIALIGFATTLLHKLSPEERYRVDDDEIKRRRFSEMTPAEAAALRELEEQEELETARNFSQVIRDYVDCRPNQIIIEEIDGSETNVQNGAEILRVFGGRVEIIRSLVSEAWRQNVLSEALKNAWRPDSASIDSSSSEGPASHGQTPGTPATSAASEASASPVGAMASSATTPINPSSSAASTAGASGSTESSS
jgi:hypothetical protein